MIPILLFGWPWINPDPGLKPNSFENQLYSSCINLCLMFEGHRRGEFVWCGWKISLCDWMSSRLCVCFSAPHSVSPCIYTHVWVLEDIKGTQVCPPTPQMLLCTSKVFSCRIKVILPVLPPPLLFLKNVTTVVFTAETSLDVGAELWALHNPSRKVWPLSFHSRGYWVKKDVTNCTARHTHTHLQLQSSGDLNLSFDHFPFFNERFEDIHSTHTHLKDRFRLESPSVAGHLLCSLRLRATDPCRALIHTEAPSSYRA